MSGAAEWQGCRERCGCGDGCMLCCSECARRYRFRQWLGSGGHDCPCRCECDEGCMFWPDWKERLCDECARRHRFHRWIAAELLDRAGQ